MRRRKTIHVKDLTNERYRNINLYLITHLCERYVIGEGIFHNKIDDVRNHSKLCVYVISNPDLTIVEQKDRYRHVLRLYGEGEDIQRLISESQKEVRLQPCWH